MLPSRKKAEDDSYNLLNIACVFSPPLQPGKDDDKNNAKNAADIKQLQEDLPQEAEDNKVNPEEKKLALKTIIADYNQQYGTNHSIGEFAWRHVHSNTIEGVWSMLKGIIRTIHHGVSKKHFLGYCHLFTFMYSNRKKSIHEKFKLLFGKFCQPRYCL